LQVRIAQLARAATEAEPMDWNQYHALTRAWEFWGAISLLLPVGAVLLMVLKPSLPAL
jgi:hypothetical protein